MYIHSLTLPLLLTAWMTILKRMTRYLKPMSPRRSMIWLFRYLHWNCWKCRNMINYVNSSWPIKPVNLTEVFPKATIDSCHTNNHRYLDYSRYSYQVAFEVDYVLWISSTRWQNTLTLQECMLLYSKPTLAADSR